MNFWKNLFGNKQKSNAFLGKGKFTQPPAISPDSHRISVTNFECWTSSTEPEAWVRAHLEGWNHQDWLDLLTSLQKTQYWPMEEVAIGRHIEMLRARLMTVRVKKSPIDDLVQASKAGDVDRKSVV